MDEVIGEGDAHLRPDGHSSCLRKSRLRGNVLQDKSDNTRRLAVGGVKFLRGDRTSRTRRA